MRFDHVTIHELGPFKHVELDLTQATGPLVAVCGPNGAGKSTLLELLVGALYRRTPTRGSLTDLATSRDGLLEVRCVNGRPWTIRQTADKVSGKSEAVVLDERGASVLTDAKVRSFDAWAAATLPPREILEASLFAAQGSHGFLDLGPGERKALLLRILGIERLERMAEHARERRRDALVSADLARAQLAEVSTRTAVDVEAALAAASTALGDHELAAEDARVALARAREEHARAETVRVERERLRADAETGRARLDALRKRIENNRGLLEHEADIRDALAELEAARLQSSVAERAAADAANLLAEAAREERRASAAVLERERRVAEAVRAMQDARARYERHRDALAHAEGLTVLEVGLRDVEARADAAERALAELQAAQAGRSAGRIEGLRGCVAIYAAAAVGAASPALARATLADDDAQAAREASYPADLLAAQVALRDARAQVVTARKARDEVAHKAAAVDPTTEAAWHAAGRRVDEERTELGTARTRMEEHAGRHADLLAATEAAKDELRRATDRVSAATRALSRWPAGVEQLLGAARARMEELEPQAAEALAHAEALAARLAALSEVPTADLTAHEQRVAASERLAREGHARVAQLQRDLDLARAADARRAELQTALAAHERDVEDWTRLSQDLGRDGLQAYEIDAAVPEFVTMVNDLLHTCVSARWTISIDTTRLSSDGKRQIEGLEVRVLDTQNGREAAVETFSGGERVLLGEAVSLALTMLACRRSGQSEPTLVRDESGAALDPERARSYVAMLRRAAGLVGASRVLLVSHSPEVVEACDSRIEVRGGEAVIA